MDEIKLKSYEGKSEAIIENPDMIICRCEEVTLRELMQAIAEGARTVNEVKRRTRAGMGLCQGRSCSRLVRKLIADFTGQKVGKISPGTYRPPVRPLPLNVVASLEVNTNVKS